MKSRVIAFLAIILVIAAARVAIIHRVVTIETAVNASSTLAAVNEAATSTKPFTILIVPGHDTHTGGAHYKDIYERDIVVTIAEDMANILATDPRFNIIVARDHDIWNPILQDYFDQHQQDILDFKISHQEADKELLASGQKKGFG